MKRRTFLMGSAGIVGAAMLSSPIGSNAAARTRTVVLAHGSWHGAWCWKRVAKILRAKGHDVYAISYTGMGERSHLLTKDITIDTFVNDIVQLIESEELQDVILVGHSFAGVPVCGAADRVKPRLRSLVFLDSVLVEPGKHAFSIYPQDEAERRIKAASDATGGLAVPVPAKLPDVWGLVEGTPDYDWVKRRLSPHPLRSYTTPLELKNPLGNGLPCLYTECTKPPHPLLADSRQLARKIPNLRYVTLEAPHDTMITHPADTAKLILSA